MEHQAAPVLQLGALVLAAGTSSRMGTPKALLTWHGTTFLNLICDNLIAANVHDIVVVTGHADGQIRKARGTHDVQWIRNICPEDGMLSSIRCGLRQIKDANRPVMICLVDYPAVRQQTYADLAAHGDDSHIVIPRYAGRRGHPAIFGTLFFDELLHSECPQGARSVIHAHPDSVRIIDVSDVGVITDIDTPEDYRALRESTQA